MNSVEVNEKPKFLTGTDDTHHVIAGEFKVLLRIRWSRFLLYCEEADS